MNGNDIEYVVNTWEVERPELLPKLDTKNSSREKDGQTVKMPSQWNPCAIQLWEVYVCAAVLLLQPHSSIIFSHVKALCEHNDPNFLCEAVLKEHVCMGTVAEEAQEVNMYTFFDEYFSRKFQITFAKHSLHTYTQDSLDDPKCGKDQIPRVYLLGPHIQAFLLKSQFFEAQYDELVRSLRMANLPVNDVLHDGEYEMGEALDIKWDNVLLYDDPNMVLKKHGGWAVTRPVRMITPKDQLVMRLTGCRLDQLLAGVEVPDSPRHELDHAMPPGARKSRRRSSSAGQKEEGKGGSAIFFVDEEESEDSSHPSDFDVDPEHRKVVPFGVTICEMYLLLRGLLMGLETNKQDLQGSIVGQRVARGTRDGHILSAAVLADLYMRDQVDVHHWTLVDGHIAVPYKCAKRKGQPPMEHFLDDYLHDVEATFRDMILPPEVVEAPIWSSLEERGIIDNHRPSWERAYGCGFTLVDVWDLARPDILLDLKEGYLMAARVLYDKQFPDPLDEEANDVLMFCYILQHLFDMSLEAIDGMTRVLTRLCPPFQKGELFPPVTMVHSGAVILGIIDRGFRVATGSDTQLAQEAAEFNESVMERLEERFFLSDTICESLDEDQSGEITLDEFVEGMRKIDVYKDFRKERVPDDVLRTIVTDFAERLFHEVDVNMDGTLNPQELQNAFARRREEALKRQEERRWVRRAVEATAVQMGVKASKRKVDQDRIEASQMRTRERNQALRSERQRNGEWQAEIERPELLDADVDVDTSGVHR